MTGQTLQAIGHLSRHLRRWMRTGRARAIRPPKGVIGIMAPWNHACMLSLVPLATAFAAANRAMLTPSEACPSAVSARAGPAPVTAARGASGCLPGI